MNPITSKNQKLKEAFESSLYQCHFQNLSFIDMVGEVWKPLPDYEDYVMISNIGRVKLLPHLIEFTAPHRPFTKEIIKKQTIITNYNKFKQVRSKLQLGARRMVKIENTILPKDKNPYNNRVENLYITADKKVISKYRLNPVTQYDRKGNVIQTFDSIAEATIKLNLNQV